LFHVRRGEFLSRARRHLAPPLVQAQPHILPGGQHQPQLQRATHHQQLQLTPSLGRAELVYVIDHQPDSVAWPLRPSATDGDRTDRGAGPVGRRWFTSLLLAYTLEGVGYIIAGTFLVAAIDQTASTTLGSSAWIIVGVAAVPSAALWAGLSRTWSRRRAMSGRDRLIGPA